MSDHKHITRREFLRLTAGSSLFIGFYLPGCGILDIEKVLRNETDPETPQPVGKPESIIEPSVFIKINTLGEITILVSKPELGQGVRTALPMIIAEEMEARWEDIRIEQAPSHQKYGDQNVGGSKSISKLYTPLREAGAYTRELLISAAAFVWSVDPGSCYAENSVVYHPPSGQQMAYKDLVRHALSRPDPAYQLKDPADFKIIGTSMGRVDNRDIIDGSAIFVSDLNLPGMRCAVVARPPTLDSVLSSYDETAALQVPGVEQVVEIDRGVAVVADNTWRALQGRNALNPVWVRDQALLPGIFARNQDKDPGPGGSFIKYSRTGRWAKPDKNGVFVAEYIVPNMAHVPMEPMTCAADVSDDACIVWAPTQVPKQAKATASNLTGIPVYSDHLQVLIPLVGGGFGRRNTVDYVEEAVQISQRIGAPVKVFWSREDDIKHDYFHPNRKTTVQASLNTAELPSMSYSVIPKPINTGAWRSVRNFDEGFARECFMDEYAVRLGMDPVELRMAVYPDEGWKAVLQKAVDESNWNSPQVDGIGRGLACFSTWGVSHVAMVVEVSLDDENRVRVHKVVSAVDCGTVINPNMVKEQIEGGIVYGLSAALGNEITLVDGEVQQKNFYDYPILRMRDMPEIEVHILPSTRPPEGIGEMGVPPIAPAVVNALANLTGKRVYRLPIRI